MIKLLCCALLATIYPGASAALAANNVELRDAQADTFYAALQASGIGESVGGRNIVSLSARAITCASRNGSDITPVTCTVDVKTRKLTAGPDVAATLFQILTANGGATEAGAAAYDIDCRRDLAVDNLTVCSFFTQPAAE